MLKTHRTKLTCEPGGAPKLGTCSCSGTSYTGGLQLLDVATMLDRDVKERADTSIRKMNLNLTDVIQVGFAQTSHSQPGSNNEPQ
jgi:hypothetical protein